MSSAFPLTSPIEVIGTGGAPGQVNYSDGTNSVQLSAPTGLSGNVNFVLPSSNGTTDQILSWNASGNTEWINNISNSNSSLPLSFRYNPATTTSSPYQVVSSFVYRGTNTDNTVTDILAVASTSNSAATGQVRVFDLTNSLVIAESAAFGPTNTTKIIVDLGTISNLPTGQAIFEVQLRRLPGGGGGQSELRSIQLYG